MDTNDHSVEATPRRGANVALGLILISTVAALAWLITLHSNVENAYAAAASAESIVKAAHELDTTLNATVGRSLVDGREPTLLPRNVPRATDDVVASDRFRLAHFDDHSGLIAGFLDRSRSFDAVAARAFLAVRSDRRAEAIDLDVSLVGPSMDRLSNVGHQVVTALDHDGDAAEGVLFVAAVVSLLGQTLLVVWLIKLSDRAKARRAVAGLTASAERRFRTLVQDGSDIVGITDLEGRITYVSPAVEKILGYQPDDLVGTSQPDLIHPGDMAALAAGAAAVREPGGALELTCRVRHLDGRWIHLEQRITNRSDDPAIAGIVWNARDLTEQLALQDQLTFQAFHDDLTGLANRALFHDRVDHALRRARRTGASLGVVFLDLDGFKNVNDSFGHACGDELLRGAADRLSQTLRPSDSLARLGGDEFAVLLEDIDGAEPAAATAERLIGALRARFVCAGRDIYITGSAGLVVSLDSQEEPDELIRDADVAMYVAKVRGKNRVKVFETDMRAQLVDRAELTSDLHHALDLDQMHVVYQPAVKLATGEIEGVEALLRWTHPTRGVIPPTVFIPLAEASGQILELGRWVLTEACRTVGPWLRHQPTLTVAVNVSPCQLVDPHLVDDVRAALISTGFPASQLVLEVTESTLVDDPATAIERLDALKALGIRLAIDDFGTGYSSLAQLKNFPVDIIKIDKAFIDGLTASLESGAFVNAIVELAHTLGLDTIAEGVELQHQQHALESLGCDLAQGFLFAKPLQADQVDGILRDQAELSVRVA